MGICGEIFPTVSILVQRQINLAYRYNLNEVDFAMLKVETKLDKCLRQKRNEMEVLFRT